MESGQGFSQVEGVNLAADSSIVEVHQILTIPHAELLARVHWIRSEKRQGNLWRQWVKSGKRCPLSTAMCEELTQGQNGVIAWCCYDDIGMIFQDVMVATAPEGPGSNAASLVGHVVAQVVLCYGSNLSTTRDVETTILVFLCPKTYWMQFDPSIY